MLHVALGNSMRLGSDSNDYRKVLVASLAQAAKQRILTPVTMESLSPFKLVFLLQKYNPEAWHGDTGLSTKRG